MYRSDLDESKRNWCKLELKKPQRTKAEGQTSPGDRIASLPHLPRGTLEVVQNSELWGKR